MTPHERVAELKRLGVTETEIAKEAKCHLSLISNVIYEKTKSKRIEKLIAEKMNKKVTKVFPKTKTQKIHNKLLKYMSIPIKLSPKRKTVNS